jgi:hypothetical protein
LFVKFVIITYYDDIWLNHSIWFIYIFFETGSRISNGAENTWQDLYLRCDYSSPYRALDIAWSLLLGTGDILANQSLKSSTLSSNFHER